MRVFYQAFPIRDALRPELSWTHYRTLLRVEGEPSPGALPPRSQAFGNCGVETGLFRPAHRPVKLT
jgi:hypothetical protein